MGLRGPKPGTPGTHTGYRKPVDKLHRHEICVKFTDGEFDDIMTQSYAHDFSMSRMIRICVRIVMGMSQQDRDCLIRRETWK